MIKYLAFHKAKDEPPKVSGEYLCYTGVYWIVISYSAKHKAFNAHDDLPRNRNTDIKVKYWAELPKLD